MPGIGYIILPVTGTKHGWNNDHAQMGHIMGYIMRQGRGMAEPWHEILHETETEHGWDKDRGDTSWDKNRVQLGHGHGIGYLLRQGQGTAGPCHRIYLDAG